MARRPVNSPYTISTEFGVPDENALFKFHSGVDYAVGTGTPVYAPVAGVVRYAQEHPIRGRMVGIWDGQFTHRLMHNSKLEVRVGQLINEGDVVALSGSTGLSTGPHVHWDIIKGDVMDAKLFSVFMDPWEWLQARQVPVTQIPAVEIERLKPDQRKVGSAGVNHRDAPNTSAAIRREWSPGEVLDFRGYVTGQHVNGSDKWFVGLHTGGFLHSQSFNNTSTDGLPDLTLELFPPHSPKPAVPQVPVEPSYEPFQAQLACVTHVVPAHVTNYEKGNFPAMPAGVVIHDYGTDGRDTTGSAHNHFMHPNTTAPHFSVDEHGIYQHGKLTWRMYHAGPDGNDKIGIEVHPNVDENEQTAANLEKLLFALDDLFGKIRRHKHSEYMATACGDDIRVDRFWLEAMYPSTTTTTTTVAAPIKVNGGIDLGRINKALAAFIAAAITTFLIKHNIVISDNLPDLIEMLLAGLFVALGVYQAPKNVE